MSAPLLEMKGIGKRFPGVVALDDVSLSIDQGEVLALLGENGAGKSTLIKILAGAHQPDFGEILLTGERISIANAQAARDAGISVIYQEFNLVPQLTVAENISLGREPSRLGVIDRREVLKRANHWLEKLGMEIDPNALCGSLTVAQQQVVEIVKAVSMDARILVMDEPSAVLTDREVKKLFRIVEDLRDQGISVIYISHRLEEIFAIADRLVVLRDGKFVGEKRVAETTREELIEMMVGRSLESEFPEREPDPGAMVLEVKGLTRRPAVDDVSFQLRRGEIVGMFGLVGSGRTELLRMLCGADRREGGSIFLDSEEVNFRNPREAIASGICMLSEDRKGEGLILSQPVVENFGLPSLRSFSNGISLSSRMESEGFQNYASDLQIKFSNGRQAVKELSGGNQQKVVLAKWLERDADIFLIDEPTRGIDVGAKFEIYELIHSLADQGKAIVMVSSELPEIMGLADRILVMHEGQMKGEVANEENTTREEVLALAMGHVNSKT